MQVRLTKRDGARVLEVTLLTPESRLPPAIEYRGAVFLADSVRGDCAQYVERLDLPESPD